ncbi:GlxA family transcriptional regulator [Echinicola rosea]|uniref:AraC family transcriptional regulator n=1 Tax=Echinicola rosea TaxID=1807691 RepID=A0ABQ1V511_9BACT|nr:helix-turn-helix domain-containing protein [Echinicola rosea]GGF37011.1 AraC family transcriptional regulator [Echinicola rosea]
MKSVSILVPESSVMEAVADPRYMFTVANKFLVAAGRKPLFDVRLVGMYKEIKLGGGVFSVFPDAMCDEVEATDLIIIPALFGDMKESVASNVGLIPWILKQHAQGAEVASLCVGAFLLAATGLLEGKKCSTHWAYYNEFRGSFPEVEVVDGGVITEDNGIYSSGGANSYWNLLLYLLEKYTDRDTAILAAKYFAIDIDRDSQGAFTIFNGQKDHGDLEIMKAQEFIEQHYGEKITVDQLARMVALSRRSFERRFKQMTGNTVIAYFQRVKIEAAKRSFESSGKNISEVMFDVGYTDSKAFRSVFKKITGLTPNAYRNKYHKVLPAI